MNSVKAEKITCLKPADWLYKTLLLIFFILLGLLFRLRFRRDPAIRSLKGPILVLGNHPSYIDPPLMAMAVWPHRVHFLTSSTFFRIPLVRPLMQKIQAIPKTQFRSDSHALKKMLQVIRCGGVLGIYPEGQRSLDGSLQPIDAAIGKLIKKTACNVVLVRETGAYLSWPRWSKSLMRSGRIEITSSLLFTPERLAEMDTEEIQAELLAALHYNDYEWQQHKRHTYLSPAPAKGLQQFCHRCPACERNLAMRSTMFGINCRYCGYRWKMDRFGMLYPIRRKKVKSNNLPPSTEPAVQDGATWQIRQLADPWHWRRWQIQVMAEEFRKPDYTLTVASDIHQVNPDGSSVYLGHGLLRLDRSGLLVTSDPGTAPMRIMLPVLSRTGISAEYGRKFEITLEDKGYRFFPDDGQSVIMMADAIQALQGLLTGNEAESDLISAHAPISP